MFCLVLSRGFVIVSLSIEYCTHILSILILLYNSKEANTGVMQVLGDQIRNNPDRLLSNIDQVSACLERARYAFPLVSHQQHVCNPLYNL